MLDDVLEERLRQDRKWGEQNHPDRPDHASGPEMAGEVEHVGRWALEEGPSWAAILLEEVGEAVAEEDTAKLRAELVQVAAVAVAWIEAIDRRKRDA